MTDTDVTLHAALRKAADALRHYAGAPHEEIEDDYDGTPMLCAVFPAAGRALADQALADADAVLATDANSPASRLVDDAKAQVARIKQLAAADATDRESIQRECGWMEAVEYFAKRGELTHAGKVEASKLLAASRDWLAEFTGEEVTRDRQ